MNISEIKIGEKYRYIGFYRGEDRDEEITVTGIDRKKGCTGFVSMSNNISTFVEKNGEVNCLRKID